MSSPVPTPPRPKTPNFARFILSGSLLGFLLAAVTVAATGGVQQRGMSGTYSAASGVGIVGLLGAGLGAILAAVVAVLLDRRGRAQAQRDR